MRNLKTLLFSFLLVSSLTYGQNDNSTTVESIYGNGMQEDTIAIAFDSITFSKSSEMLDEDVYWSIVANSLKETNNQEDQELFLITEIQKRTPTEIIGFRLRTDQLLFDSYHPELWCAAYIVSEGISDGGFEYFRCWLISRGKEVFYSVKANPDSLIKQVVEDKESYEFEGFWYVAMNAFKNSTGEDLYSYIDYDQFVTNDENYPLLEFNWNVEEPQTMKKICPVLFKNLWKQ